MNNYEFESMNNKKMEGWEKEKKKKKKKKISTEQDYNTRGQIIFKTSLGTILYIVPL